MKKSSNSWFYIFIIVVIFIIGFNLIANNSGPSDTVGKAFSLGIDYSIDPNLLGNFDFKDSGEGTGWTRIKKVKDLQEQYIWGFTKGVTNKQRHRHGIPEIRMLELTDTSPKKNAVVTQIVPVEAHKEYELSISARLVRGDPTLLRLEFLDAEYNVLGSDQITVGPSEWKEGKFRVLSLADTDFARVILKTRDKSKTVLQTEWITLEEVEAGPEPDPEIKLTVATKQNYYKVGDTVLLTGKYEKLAESAKSCQSFDSLSNTNNVVSFSRNLASAWGGDLCPSSQDKMMGSILSLVKKRRDLLKTAIRENPALALEVEPLPDSLLGLLQTQSQVSFLSDNRVLDENGNQLVETREPQKGSLAVWHVHDHILDKETHYAHYLQKDGKDIRLYGGDLPTVQSGFSLDIQGVRLDDIMAVGDVEVLAPPKGSPAEENLGEQRFLVLVIGIQGHPDPPHDIAIVEDLMFGGQIGTVKDYYLTNSYGKTTIAGEVIGPYIVDAELCDKNSMEDESLLQASVEVDLGTYDRFIFVMPPNTCPSNSRSSATVGKRNIELPGIGVKKASVTYMLDNIVRTYIHELGHNFGARHANLFKCTDLVGSSVPYSIQCETDKYGDHIDVMGSGTVVASPRSTALGAGPNTGPLMNAPHKYELGWLEDTNYLTVSEGTFTVHALDEDFGEGVIQELRIPIEQDYSYYGKPENLYYSIAMRNLEKYNNGKKGKGLTIHMHQFNSLGEFTFRTSNIINARWDINSGRSLEDQLYYVGDTFTDKIHGFVVQVDSLSDDEATITVTRIPKVLPDFSQALLAYDFDESNKDSSYDSKGLFKGNIEYPPTKDKALILSPEHKNKGLELLVAVNNIIHSQNSFGFSMWFEVDKLQSKDEGSVSLDMFHAISSPIKLSLRLDPIRGDSISFSTTFISESPSNLEKKATLPITIPLPPIQSWYHLAGAFDGSKVRLYLDGEKVSEMEQYKDPYDGIYYPLKELFLEDSQRIYIGSTADLYGLDDETNEGLLLDNYRIYARGVSGAEVQEIFVNEKKRLKKPLAIIKNLETQPVTGTISLLLEEKKGGEWHKVYTVYEDVVTLKGSEELSLDEFWNAQQVQVSTVGVYRVEVVFANDKGTVESFWEFEVE